MWDIHPTPGCACALALARTDAHPVVITAAGIDPPVGGPPVGGRALPRGVTLGGKPISHRAVWLSPPPRGIPPTGSGRVA